MQYKLTQKTNPANRLETAKWYAVPINKGKITPYQLNKKIIKHTRIKKELYTKLMNTLTNEISALLMNGYSVNFGEMGTFRVSFSSGGVEKEEDFTPEMISNIRVIFRPSVELQQKLKNQLTKTSNNTKL